jgi:hypothetical protein
MTGCAKSEMRPPLRRPRIALRSIRATVLQRHCEEQREEAIQLLPRFGKAGLLRFTRNDGLNAAAYPTGKQVMKRKPDFEESSGNVFADLGFRNSKQLVGRISVSVIRR